MNENADRDPTTEKGRVPPNRGVVAVARNRPAPWWTARRTAGPVGLTLPFVPRAKLPSRVAETSSVSYCGQRCTSMQAAQIFSGGAVVSTMWSNFMIFTYDLSARSKVPEGFAATGLAPLLRDRLSSGMRRLTLLHAAVPPVPLVLLSLVDGHGWDLFFLVNSRGSSPQAINL